MEDNLPKYAEGFGVEIDFSDVKMFKFDYEGRGVLCTFREKRESEILRIEWEGAKNFGYDLLVSFGEMDGQGEAFYVRFGKNGPEAAFALVVKYKEDTIGFVDKVSEISDFTPVLREKYCTAGEALINNFRKLERALKICADAARREDAVKKSIGAARGVVGMDKLKEWEGF